MVALIEAYGLEPLPVEGTLFASTYRSRGSSPDGAPVGTAMIGLYAHDPLSRSLFHRLPSDEVWHFYDGDPIRLVLLHPDGEVDEVWLGADVGAGQRVQAVVPAGVWQAGELAPDGTYALFGCTMAPGLHRGGFRRWSPERAARQPPERRRRHRAAGAARRRADLDAGRLRDLTSVRQSAVDCCSAI